MKTYQLFIGSNNQTKQLEKQVIENILAEHFEGFTLQEGTGYWHGEREQTAIVTVSFDGPMNKLEWALSHLKNSLKQQAIAFMQVPELLFY